MSRLLRTRARITDAFGAVSRRQTAARRPRNTTSVPGPPVDRLASTILAPNTPLILARVLTFERLKWASFTHSAIYTVLLVVWLVPGLAGLEAVFGMGHGLGWIAMSLACIVALRLRVIDLRLAVAVAVLGGIGPFIGSYEFVRQSRVLQPGPPAGVVPEDPTRQAPVTF